MAFAILPLGAAVAADPAVVACGKYLATVASCHDCHTPGYFLGKPDMARYLGGLGCRLRAARARPLDRCPDPGGPADRRAARRPRAGADHAFAALTTQDADAIVAFLCSLPPVGHKVPGPFGPTEPPTSFVMKIVPPAAK